MLAGYICPEKELEETQNSQVHISLVRASKKNFVTHVSGLSDQEKALKFLKRHLCCNGNLKEGNILEFQGDQRQKLALFLGERSGSQNIKIHGI
ncbi:translation initiation factor SUI1 [Tokyovirus A1]|uniref:translation initiation factor SUI1 n=1 Tax=Tokyovirus A1 TaxID=1826170 RepID=UPI0007A96B5C|nr:translation initiation factor SUI1 [Tokyovirus A1]BAU80003.1 translation initiation factor SUI1 [Tokyovirus A1]